MPKMPKEKHKYVKCSNCSELVQARLIGECIQEDPVDDGSYEGAWVQSACFSFYQCPKCTSPIVTVWAEEFSDGDPVRVVYPLPPFMDLVNEIKSVPSQVRKDLLEADRCYHNKLFNAFGAMARRVVHSVCANKKAFAASNLCQQIDDIRTRNLISSRAAEYMHSLRTMGRNGSHPEWEEITQEMADEGMKMLLWLIKDVYEIDLPQPPTFSEKKRYELPKRPPNFSKEMNESGQRRSDPT